MPDIFILFLTLYCPTPLEYSIVHITVPTSVHFLSSKYKERSVSSRIVFKTCFNVQLSVCAYIKDASHFEILCECLRKPYSILTDNVCKR